MSPYFVGRDEITEALVEQLTNGNSLALSAEGLPGIGKTTLAVALSHHREVLDHFKGGVLWASLGPKAKEEDVAGILTRWADALGIDVTDIAEIAGRKQAVEDAIGQRSLLIIIDDAWDIDVARQLRFGNPRCRHLLTTRDQKIARQFAGASGTISVPTLEDDPSFQLLQELAPEACAAGPEVARALARAVGGLPLALELLGGYLSIPEHSLLPQLSQAALEEMMDPRRRLQLAQERLGAPGQKVTLEDTIALSIEGLRELENGEEAEQAFYALGAFVPKPETFSWEAAEVVAGVKIEVLAQLVARNLVEQVGEQLALHQVLADVARTKLERSAVTRHREYYLSLVNEDQEAWQRIENVYGQIKWAWETAPRDSESPEFVEILRLYQKRRGLLHDNLEWAHQALEVPTIRPYDEGKLLNILGLNYASLGLRDKALEYLEQALSVTKEIDDRAGQSSVVNNMGATYASLGQQDKALECYKQALPLCDDIGTRATILNNIGAFYARVGQHDEALEHYRQALSIYKSTGSLGGQALALKNIGAAHNRLDQPEKALDYLDQAAPILEKIGDFSMQAATFYDMAIIYRDHGRSEEAVAVLKKAAELAQWIAPSELEIYQTTLAEVKAELVEKQEED